MRQYNICILAQETKEKEILYYGKTRQKNTANDFAVNEHITPLQLLQEIEPLLKEYFIGDFEIKNNALNIKFKNGQTFILKIGEVV